MEEESGDRWLGSDLAKAIRFYQRAYLSYLRVLEMPIDTPQVKLDAYYNISRLLFHVYTQYFRTDGVSVNELQNIDEVLTSEQSVIQKLPVIVQYHEQTAEISHQLQIPLSTDLLYNTALVYTQVIEDQQDNLDSDMEEIYILGQKTQTLLNDLLTLQVNQLKSFIEDLKVINTNDPSSSSQNTSTPTSEHNVSGEQVLQPPDVFDTLLTGCKLSQAILENINDPQLQIPRCQLLILPFVNTCDTIANELISEFGQGNNAREEYLSSIETSQIHEYQILKVYLESLLINDMTELVTFWDQHLPQLPEIPDKYLLFSDGLQEFLDRNEVNLTTANQQQNIAEGFWKLLTSMTNSLKKAQELLGIQKSQLNFNSEDLGQVIITISNIMIQRSDIDLQRCQIQTYEPAIKNQQLLMKNAEVFLKSAMNMANTSGGLRERACYKMVRNHKKIEAVMRLCLLQGKTSSEELDTILGPQIWPLELENLKKLEYFQAFIQ